MPHNRWVWLSPFWRPQGCLAPEITCGKFSSHHRIFRIRASRLLKEISRECCKFKSANFLSKGAERCLASQRPTLLSYSLNDFKDTVTSLALEQVQRTPVIIISDSHSERFKKTLQAKGTNSGEYGFHGPARRWELSRYLLQNTQLKVCCVFDK
jgi:hypothetical protein